MVFSSLLFLFYFLPATLAIYFISPQKLKNIVLLIVSLFFYAWGEPVYICLILFSALVDYILGRLIEKYRRSQKSKWLLVSSLIVNIAVLAFFKYANFLIENINVIFGIELTYLNLPLPIGISFYTFQTMSYIIDVYRGRVTAQRSFISFAMYVTLFPQLIAGPIVRYELIESQMKERMINFAQFSDGVRFFIKGLGKKVLLANNIGLLWVEIESTALSELTLAMAWLGIIAFSFQIYFDFSGYSDMAIGLGKMFGFEFPRNFHYPYISRSIAEFWRRWHITLGSWFREYVYIPLGGNRKGPIRMYMNLLLVWMLTGFWHGASWNFIIWGLYFGILISLERAFLQKVLNYCHPIFQHFYFAFFILIGWVFFVFEDIKMGWQFLGVMFGIGENGLINPKFFYLLFANAILLFIAFVGSLPRPQFIENIVQRNTFIEAFIYFVILLFSTAYLAGASYNPFLYFRF